MGVTKDRKKTEGRSEAQRRTHIDVGERDGDGRKQMGSDDLLSQVSNRAYIMERVTTRLSSRASDLKHKVTTSSNDEGQGQPQPLPVLLSDRP